MNLKSKQYLYTFKNDKKKLCITNDGVVRFFDGRKIIDKKNIDVSLLPRFEALKEKDYSQALDIIIPKPNLNDIEVLDLSDCDNTNRALNNMDFQLQSLENGLVKKKKTYFSIHKNQTPLPIKSDSELELQELRQMISKKIDEIGITKLIVNKEKVVVTDYNPNQKKIDYLMNVIEDKLEEFSDNLKKVESNKPIKESNPLTELLKATNANVLRKFNNKLRIIAEYTPKYKISGELETINIPRTEIIGFDLTLNETIELGELQLKIISIEENKVSLEVVNAKHIVNKQVESIKEESIIELSLDEKTELYLNEEEYTGVWVFTLSKENAQKEIRRTDYLKIMSILKHHNKLSAIGNIERFETQLSIMLFLNFVMKNNDYKKIDSLYQVMDYNIDLYEECITKYNIECAMHRKNKLSSAKRKEEFMKKANFVNGLINSNMLTYPRYIFRSHNYFNEDSFMKEFYSQIKQELTEMDLYNSFIHLFKDYDVFTNMEPIGNENLNKCLKFLSKMYYKNPKKGESTKYTIEEEFLIGTDVETLSLIISRLCAQVVNSTIGVVLSKTDKEKYKEMTKSLKEYIDNVEEMYRSGNLNYPIYSEIFKLCE